MRLASSPDRCCEPRTECCAKNPRRTPNASLGIPSPQDGLPLFLPRRRRRPAHRAAVRRSTFRLARLRGWRSAPSDRKSLALLHGSLRRLQPVRTFRHRQYLQVAMRQKIMRHPVRPAACWKPFTPPSARRNDEGSQYRLIS
jgi:hypothetical protein